MNQYLFIASYLSETKILTGFLLLTFNYAYFFSIYRQENTSNVAKTNEVFLLDHLNFMKYFSNNHIGLLLVFFYCMIDIDIFAQKVKVDSLVVLLKQSHKLADSSYVNLLNNLAWAYRLYKPDSSLHYATLAYELAEKIRHAEGRAKALGTLGAASRIIGNYDKALSYYLRSLHIRDSLNDLQGISYLYNNIGVIYRTQGMMDKAEEYFLKSLAIKQQQNDEAGIATAYNNLGEVFLGKDESPENLNQAIKYFEQALEIRQRLGEKRAIAVSLNSLGDAYCRKGNSKKGLSYLEKALEIREKIGDIEGTCVSYYDIANCFLKNEQFDSANFYIQKSLTVAQKMSSRQRIMRAYELLEKIALQTEDYKNAHFYLNKFKTYKDSIYDEQRTMLIVEMQTKFQTQQKEQELAHQKALNENQQRWLWAVSVMLVISLVLSFFVYRNYHEKKKAHELLRQLYIELNEQKEEITVQAEELKEANDEILMMNENLEKMVKERTQKIEQQNIQIIGYAFANAHRVRGPLARILGLVSLMKKGIKTEEIPQYIEMLDKAAQELNTVVKEINELLEEETQEKWSLTSLKKMLE